MLTYVGIIMLMSLSFSIVIYGTSVTQLERQRPTDTVFQTATGLVVVPSRFTHFINQRIDEAHQAIIWQLIALNLATFFLSLLVSYFLARKNLEPIEASMYAQSQFVSDASHELRTPLTSVITSNEVALRKQKLTLAEAKTIIQETVDEAHKLQNLTDGLLTLVRNEHVSEHSLPVNIQTLISRAVTQVAPKATPRQIAVDDYTTAMMAAVQPDSIERVLIIILDNAIKYSPDGSRITITSHRLSKQVAVTITDTGIGIAADDLSHIFTRFYRADKSRSEAHGYGLGLAIARQIVTSHGGDITVVSELEKGSSFTITLPAA